MYYNKQNTIKVLIVDDSAFMRSALKGMISSDPELEVIGTARDGEEAIAKVGQLKPDVITLDLEMPRMNGIDALKVIMEKMPTPVLVVSSLSTEGADITFQALELGAVDFICKDLQSRSLNIMNIEETLVAKLKEMAKRIKKEKPRKIERVPAIIKPERKSFGGTRNVAVVAIGVSTGGPKALQEVIPYLPKDLPAAVLIVQHMPVLFTKPFAERLDNISKISVKEAEDGELIEQGRVYIAKGGVHMKANRLKPLECRIELNKNPENILYHPSVDIMMLSVVSAYTDRCVGVIMTGMGNDGTEGIRAIKYYGGKTIAQNEESCVVYGMPKSAVDAGVVDKVVPLNQLAFEIVNMV